MAEEAPGASELATQEARRTKWRTYAKASYDKNKEERRRRMREAYYRRTGRTPRDFAKQVVLRSVSID